MTRPPDPEKRNPAAENGRAIRNSAKDGEVLKPNKNYATGSIISRRPIYSGRSLLGRISETSLAWHQALNADGEPLCSFRTQIEALTAKHRLTERGLPGPTGEAS